MSLKTEGNDPQGFMNVPNRTAVSSLKAENEWLRAALTRIGDDSLDDARDLKDIARVALNQQQETKP